jgi:hypothetical protein
MHFFTDFQANTDEESTRSKRSPVHSTLLGGSNVLTNVWPHIGEQLVLPAVTETPIIKYGGISGYLGGKTFPGPYHPGLGKTLDYTVHPYPSYESSIIEDVLIEKPLQYNSEYYSTWFSGYPGHYGFQNNHLLPSDNIYAGPLSPEYYGYNNYYGHPSKYLPSTNFGDFYPGLYAYNSYPGYASHSGFEGPYSHEFYDFLRLYGYPRHYGQPAIVENIEEILTEKPIWSAHHRYPRNYGFPKHYGYPTVVEEIEKIVVDQPISTGHFGYSGYQGFPGIYGYPTVAEEVEKIVVDQPISAGHFGYPGYHGFPGIYGYPTVAEEVEKIVVDQPISTGHFGYPGYHGYPKHY